MCSPAIPRDQDTNLDAEGHKSLKCACSGIKECAQSASIRALHCLFKHSWVQDCSGVEHCGCQKSKSRPQNGSGGSRIFSKAGTANNPKGRELQGSPCPNRALMDCRTDLTSAKRFLCLSRGPQEAPASESSSPEALEGIC